MSEFPENNNHSNKPVISSLNLVMDSIGHSTENFEKFKIPTARDRVIVKKLSHNQMKAFKKINFYKSYEPEVEQDNQYRNTTINSDNIPTPQSGGDIRA